MKPLKIKNPFVVGVPVEGENFANRKEEKQEILDTIQSGQNLILYAPRRYGKSSLLREISSSLPSNNYIVIWLDLSEVSTVRGFLERMVKELHRSSKTGKLADFIQETLPRFLSMFRIGLGDLDISISVPPERDLEELTLEVFDLPEKIGVQTNKRVVVIFDEFQDLLLLENNLDKKLRARIQYHKQASYVFMGSRKSLINKIFFDRKSPFYYIGKKIEINYIPTEEFKPFIQERFRATGKEIKENQLNKVLEATKGHPYFTQHLCFEIWNLASERVTDANVNEALEKCISAQSYLYEMLVDQIRSKDQRNVLFFLARHGPQAQFDVTTLTKMEIKNPNAITLALRKLVEMELIERNKRGQYRLVDPFFALFLKTKLEV
ncbi:MAG: ATP-binding protein [candidate division KSB1 bacterium]|nr:ATP-binding protein [candidate division KSB1 bacterium]